MFYIGLGLIFTVFCVTLLYLMLVGKGRLKSDRNRRLDDEAQMEFIKRTRKVCEMKSIELKLCKK